MKILDILIPALIVLLAVLALRRVRKKGGGCGQGCAGCPHAGACEKAKKP